MDPDVGNARHRADSDGAANYYATVKNTLPRLAIDGSGRMWLAFRSPHPTWWNPIGTVWTEYLVSFNGKEWTRPIFLNHTDNLLDNRPALAAVANGKLADCEFVRWPAKSEALRGEFQSVWSDPKLLCGPL